MPQPRRSASVTTSPQSVSSDLNEGKSWIQPSVAAAWVVKGERSSSIRGAA